MQNSCQLTGAIKLDFITNLDTAHDEFSQKRLRETRDGFTGRNTRRSYRILQLKTVSSWANHLASKKDGHREMTISTWAIGYPTLSMVYKGQSDF